MGLPPEFTDLADAVRNWGRWGPDDELGTINLVTPEVRRRAAACVRTGRALSLALPLDESEGIQTGVLPGRINPVRTHDAGQQPDPPVIRPSSAPATTSWSMGLQCATHWDGLAHVSYGGHIWNGYPADTVTARRRQPLRHPPHPHAREPRRAARRGPGPGRRTAWRAATSITGDDLDAAEELAGVRSSRATSSWCAPGRWRSCGSGAASAGTPAPSPGLVDAERPWLRQRDVAAVATDTLDLRGVPRRAGRRVPPVHMLHLVDMGLTQGQNFVLDELAADCADDGVLRVPARGLAPALHQRRRLARSTPSPSSSVERPLGSIAGHGPARGASTAATPTSCPGPPTAACRGAGARPPAPGSSSAPTTCCGARRTGCSRSSTSPGWRAPRRPPSTSTSPTWSRPSSSWPSRWRPRARG